MTPAPRKKQAREPSHNRRSCSSSCDGGRDAYCREDHLAVKHLSVEGPAAAVHKDPQNRAKLVGELLRYHSTKLAAPSSWASSPRQWLGLLLEAYFRERRTPASRRIHLARGSRHRWTAPVAAVLVVEAPGEQHVPPVLVVEAPGEQHVPPVLVVEAPGEQHVPAVLVVEAPVLTGCPSASVPARLPRSSLVARRRREGRGCFLGVPAQREQRMGPCRLQEQRLGPMTGCCCR